MQAQQHEAALQQAQRQLEQQTAAATAASEASERSRLEAELLQRQLHTLETERQELLARADEDRAAAQDARHQVRVEVKQLILFVQRQGLTAGCALMHPQDFSFTSS